MDKNQVGAVRETAGQEGTAVAQHARQAAGEVSATAREQAGQVAQEATGQAKHVVRDMRERVAGEAEDQARRVSRQIDRIADELGTMADNSGPDSMTAGTLRQVSDAGRQAARYLDERGARGLLDSAQDFARRKPGTFLIGAAVAGFLVARAAKSMGTADQSRAAQPQRGYTDQMPTTPVTTPTAAPMPPPPVTTPPPTATAPAAAPPTGTPSREHGTVPPGYPAPSPRTPYQPEGAPYVKR
ncbi:hypothetical protein [Saccharothrix deserti]|uniref:hypothetical protein n=1 Tax=Saccharothrix deserti TaxID=2593674 RepID=UPI00131DD00A|nr:hypothetical protein [Saccharothrix deserti]